jgi:hypothetical protein
LSSGCDAAPAQQVARIASQHRKCLLPDTLPRQDAYRVESGMAPDFFSEVTMRILITAAMFSVLALSPASAKMMACTAANIGTSAQAMEPGQTAANKEIAAANTDVSNGKMRSACKHYMNAQKLSMAK